MDTSKKYTDMCYKARELQTKNFFQLVAERATIQEYATEFGGVATELYRQDQLQNIVLEDRLSVFDLMRDFNKFCDFEEEIFKDSNPYTCELNSMEQL